MNLKYNNKLHNKKWDDDKKFLQSMQKRIDKINDEFNSDLEKDKFKKQN